MKTYVAAYWITVDGVPGTPGVFHADAPDVDEFRQHLRAHALPQDPMPAGPRGPIDVEIGIVGVQWQGLGERYHVRKAAGLP